LRTTSELRLLRLAESAARKSSDPTRHKCVVSYHMDDDDEVATFIEDFGTVFIPTVIGVTEDDDFVDSDDTDYIMDRIREEYLGNTTVTIVLVGACTWSRRFVDWEIYSSLRDYKNYGISGLMGITLPSVSNDSDRQLPPRLEDNVDGEKGYARWWRYPSSAASLRSCIEIAFNARKSKTHLIDNSRDRKKYNSACS
jgi:Thoeris protein ThsB, TIR-like domain